MILFPLDLVNICVRGGIGGFLSESVSQGNFYLFICVYGYS